MTPEKLRTWYLCRETLLDLIKDRSYTTDQKHIPFENFSIKDVSQLKFVCQNNDQLVGIHFIDDDKIGKSSIERVIEYYKNLNINHIILVVSVKMSSACSNIVNTNQMKIEIFKDEELMFNITKHELVPKHRIISEDEKQQLFVKLKISAEQMPKILKRDPVCRYLGAESGDVVEILRNSRTAGVSVYYKIVEDKIMKL